MVMPTAQTRGYGLFRGRVACDCLRAWLPVFEAELKRLGVIQQSIDIAQLTGGASASGGTHSQGGAADVWQRDSRTIKVAREMGAAAWARTKAQGFDPHCHLVLNGCPHNSPARYQVTALRNGFNGLGYLGQGGRDDGPTPRALRTWTAGIRWARNRQKPPKPKRVAYTVFVARDPGDFLRQTVVVRTGPGHEYPAQKTRTGAARALAHGTRVVMVDSRRSKAGDLWRKGSQGGWIPDRRLRKA